MVLMNEIINDDCLNIIEKLDNNSIDVCLTDPPYGIDFQSGQRKNKLPKITNDKQPFVDWIEPLFNKMKEGGRLLCFYRWDVQDAVLNEIKRSGFNVKSQIIWNKVMYGMGDLTGEFSPQHESIIYATKGRYEFKNKRPSTVITVPRKSPDKLLHPNEKPYKLIEQLLLSISSENELIFEPFAGSGVLCEVCMNNNRNFIATELSDYYFKIAQERISNKTTKHDYF